MANTTLTADIIAKAAVALLDNELVMAKKVFRGYEEEFSKNINGYEVGSTISIRRPMDFTVRDGPVLVSQDVTEGKFALTVDQRKGVDFEFSSQDLTLNIKDLSERAIKPAMVQLANQIDGDLHALYKDVPNWVGTPGETVNSFPDFALAPERMDDYSNPQDGRCAVMSPADTWGMVGNLTGLDLEKPSTEAYRKGRLGMVANVDMYSTQNVKAHTTGTFTTGSTPLTAGAGQETTYDASKDTDQWTLSTDGWAASTAVLNPGDVISIAGVKAVNSVTKDVQAFDKQFTVVSGGTSDGAGAADLVLTPAAIATGAHKTVSTSIPDGAVITPMGAEDSNYRQNMVFCKNAFTLVSVPLVDPPGAVTVARETYKGTTVRVIPVYDGINDVSAWRLDVLYGVLTTDKRQAVRLSGSPAP